MNGNTLFEINPGNRSNSFARPPPLKIPNIVTNDFGRSSWGSHRGLWQDNSSASTRTSDGLVDRRTQGFETRQGPHTEPLAADSLRQKSTSAFKFAQSSNGTALSPIENPRSSARPNGNPWTSSKVSSLNTPQQIQLTSPIKQQYRAWPFSEDIDFDSENFVLLRDSAPDIDPADEELTRNGFRIDERAHFSHQDGGTRPSFFNSQNNFTFPSHNTNNFDGGANMNGSLGSHPNSKGNLPVAKILPAPRQYSTATTYTDRAQFPSPTSTRLGTTHYRDSQSNSTHQRVSPTDHTTDSMRSLSLSTQGPGGRSERPGSDPFRSEYSSVPSTQQGPNSATSQLRLNVEHADFQPAWYSNSLEYAEDSLQPSYFANMWALSRLGTPYSSDFRNHAPNPYYSAGVTPPTGPASGRSIGGSGISSRTSHHDFSVIDGKLGSMDMFQQHVVSQGNELLSNSQPRYEMNPTPTIRMNPLAGTYTPFSASGFNIGGYSTTLRMPLREQEPQVVRSPLLEDFRANLKTNKRYELRDIFQHVVEFSGDQHGSRFIQQKLETANSDEKDQIFKEIQPNSIQLMTDVFGNYVVQKLFEHASQAQKKTLAHQMKGHVLNLSMQMYGCRVVQKALEHVLTDQQASMVKELDGPNKQILRVIRDQNGNHVVQKAIERVSAEHIHFIVEAHKGEVVKLATHTYGCRVIQRILENCQPAAKRIILDELHGCVTPLITDNFGNYVVQHIIAKGEPEDRRLVVSIVQKQILNFSKHKFASNVVEKCIEKADDDQRVEIFRRLVERDDQGQTPVLGLLRDQYGNYVIQKVHALLKGSERDALVKEMKLCLPQLKRTSYGKQVMAIEKLLYGINDPFSVNNPFHSSPLTVSSPNSHDLDHQPVQVDYSHQQFRHGSGLSTLNTCSQ